MSDDEKLAVVFCGPALEEWRKAYPDLPPGDEVVLYMRPSPCSSCGEKIKDNEIGGFDPEGLTDEGEIFGTHFCQSCMEKGF